MRTLPGLRARTGLLVLPLIVGLAGPAHAETTGPLGGARLASRGVVVDPAAPALPPTTAAGWLVADLDTGEVLAAKNPHGTFAPASTLKTLTALTLIPRLDARAYVRPTFDDVNIEGSRVGLVDTVDYPISQLFTAMLVVSGNDAAQALATANGGVATTVEQMNAEAQRIQALDTRAVNTSGLDAPGQVSSPYDLALIGRAGMALPAFRDYVKTKRTKIRGPRGTTIAISTHDKLLYNYDGAIGIKNGYTNAARASFVGAATRGGHTLLVTLMKTNPRYWPEAASLLDWGFDATARRVAPVGQLLDPLPDPSSSTTPTDTGVSSGTQSVRPVAVRAASGSDLPLLPAALVVAGLGVVGTGVQRTRRRPRKLRLPPL